METKRIIHPYFLYNVETLELWLKTQAQKGWSLVDNKGYVFEFIKSTPKEKEYLVIKRFPTYSRFQTTQHALREFKEFPLYEAKKKYKNSNSTLNKTSTDIFEVDVAKIDDEYFLLKEKRKKYFFQKYRTSFFVGLSLLALFVVITCCDINCWPGVLVALPQLFHGLLGMIKCKR